MYERLPTVKELEGTGLEPEDYASDPVDVWPECWAVFTLFANLRTQWRMGINGPTGLDYGAVVTLLDFFEVKGAERRQFFDEIREMELAALDAMNRTF